VRDEALKALLAERWSLAAAKYGQRLLKDPDDGVARCNRAVALYEQGRWSDAAKAFEELLRREGPASEVAPPALFSLGYCRLELEQNRGSLQASTLFVELSNEDHPFYWDGVQNIACACNRLGHSALAVQLYRVVLGVQPDKYAYNGLALSLAGMGRAREAIHVLDRARDADYWDDVLESSMEHLTRIARGGARALA
jgi:tetratricopeptide (TPR) repeat protein